MWKDTYYEPTTGEFFYLRDDIRVPIHLYSVGPKGRPGQTGNAGAPGAPGPVGPPPSYAFFEAFIDPTDFPNGFPIPTVNATAVPMTSIIASSGGGWAINSGDVVVDQTGKYKVFYSILVDLGNGPAQTTVESALTVNNPIPQMNGHVKIVGTRVSGDPRMNTLQITSSFEIDLVSGDLVSLQVITNDATLPPGGPNVINSASTLIDGDLSPAIISFVLIN